MKNLFIGLSLILLLSGCGQEKEEYFCEKGTLKDNRCEIVTKADATFSCQKGYTLKENKCEKKETKDATKTKTCADGYNLGGSICLSIKSYDKVTNKICKLPNGVIEETYEMVDGSGKISNKAYEENGKCFYTVCTKMDGNGKCLTIDTKEIPYQEETVCGNGMMEVNNRCYKTSKVKNTYVCYEGTLKNKKCTITTQINAIAKCEEEFTYNNKTGKCEKIEIKDAVIKAK